MTLQTSGAISLDDIHVEAGGTTGTVVSINDTDVRNLIGSTPGTVVSFDDFYGASAVDVGIDDGALADLQVAPATSSCSITFHTNGTISTTGNLTTYGDTNWYSPTTTNIGNNYKIQVVVTGSNPTGPTLGTYHNLTSDRTWTLSRSSGIASNTLSVSLATISPSSVVDTASITMSVEST
jgi:hypothetical protein